MQREKKYTGSIKIPPRLIDSKENSLLSASLPSKTQITIVEMGGFHSTMLPVHKETGIVGGAAYVADAVNRIRQESDPILISSGDVFTGQTSAIESGGNFVIEFLNHLKFDAMTLGIHDLDDGQEILASRIERAKFPIIAANLFSTVTGTHISKSHHTLNAILPYHILDRGMQTIAFLGLMKEETPMFQNPAHLQGMTFISAEEAITRWIPEILQEAPNIIIIQYNTTSKAPTLANNINNYARMKWNKQQFELPLLVFVGGHTDQKPIFGPNYVVMQGTDRGYKLGVIKINRTQRKGQLESQYIPVSSEIYQPDPTIAPIVDQVAKKIEMNDTLLGYSKTALQRHRFHDCTLGILVTEAMKEHASSEIAFVSSGTIKLDIASGNIFSSSVDQSIPFNDSIIVMELIGYQVYEILEQSAKLEADSGGSGGKILQVAGLRFKYDVKREKGQRIVEATIAGKKLEMKRVYIAAVSEYLVSGGDGYTEFMCGVILAQKGELRTVVKEYIKRLGTLDIKRDLRIED